ncbi:DUF938 domain-containing protein [Mangrovicoccus sp. HB161399]|uniref:DUF938 domain-containing protein n=1 Tax=Mangrovicoccus sp. HB161399 TaxID=2720392 RepID=UPI001554951A|nr:DUF938 domain-containing protein [Mangrovicoccus sp. HB161399]
MARHIFQEAADAPDGRRIAAAALRNAGPLIEALRTRLPAQGRVLEVASGTGQHAVAFAEAFPALDWVPSDIDPGQRGSIEAWRRASGAANFAAPLAIDIAAPWPVETGSAQAVLAVNLLHLIPESALAPLFEGARAALGAGGRAIVYGPFLRAAGYASDGDRDFDAVLRARDPSIGYKSLEAVSGAAASAGFDPVAIDAMPANNLLLTFAAS